MEAASPVASTEMLSVTTDEVLGLIGVTVLPIAVKRKTILMFKLISLLEEKIN